MGGRSDMNLIWVNMEMTGLDPETEKILEVAAVVTNKSLEIVAKSESLVIHVDEEDLNNMNEWCQKTHKQSGLIAESKLSNITIEEADNILLSFVRNHTPAGKCALAGNSVSHYRSFMNKLLPKLNAHCHFRIVDVSTLQEITRRWNPYCFARAPKRRATHRAMEDCLGSIDELRFYKLNIFTSL